MSSDVLPDSMWEIVECHLKLYDSVGIDVRVSLSQKLHKLHIESVSAFLCDSIGA